MAIKTGSIVLGTIRYFTGKVPSRGKFTIQMLSTDLSAETTFNVQISADGLEFDNAYELGEAVTGTIADDVTTVKTYEGNPGDTFKILFAGVTTGTVNYKINGV
jgi:hypothetical protein